MQQDSRQRRTGRKGDFLAPHKCDVSGCGAGHLQSRLHGRREALAPCLFFDVAAGTGRIDPDDVSDELSGNQGAAIVEIIRERMPTLSVWRRSM